MRNKYYTDPRKWMMLLHTDETKSVILAVFRYDTIREIAGVLSLKPSQISNCYHGLVLPKGALKYVEIRKNGRCEPRGRKH